MTALLARLALATSSLSLCGETDSTSAYERALVLYQQGPSKADEVIEILEAELKDHPQNYDAVALLGITYFGTRRFEDAITRFDEAIRLTRESGEFNAQLHLMKAKSLAYLERYSEARALLVAIQAFFQTKDGREEEYEDFLELVSARLTERLLSVASAAHGEALKLGLAPTNHLFIVLDQHLARGASEDKELSSFLLPLAQRRDWWIVVVVPEQAGSAPLLGIYLDKRDNRFTGYVLDARGASVERPKHKIGPPDVWEVVEVMSDAGVPLLALRPIHPQTDEGPTTGPSSWPSE